MFLCRSPVVANDFWTDLNQAAGAGVKLNMNLARNIAQKNGCPFVSSSNLKPVDFTARQMAITDGKVKGWAAPQLYIMYVNRLGKFREQVPENLARSLWARQNDDKVTEIPVMAAAL